MGVHRFIKLAIALLLLAVAACAPPAVSVPAAREVSPELTPTPDTTAILAQLAPVATLEEAAEQCAGALGVTADAVRARTEGPVTAGTCVPCAQLPAGFTEEGVPISEITLPLAAGSSVWLTAREVTCLYLYDGEEFKPLSVQVTSH